jgi:hypothetical protein
MSREPWAGWRPAIFARYAKVIPNLQDRPDIGHVEDNTLSAKKVIAAKPDLVLMSDWGFSSMKTQMEPIAAEGIPIVVIDYNAHDLGRHLASTRAIGKVMGTEARAEGGPPCSAANASSWMATSSSSLSRSSHATDFTRAIKKFWVVGVDQDQKRKNRPKAVFHISLGKQEKLERVKGVEPLTPTLARLCSTPELHPHPYRHALPIRRSLNANAAAWQVHFSCQLTSAGLPWALPALGSASNCRQRCLVLPCRRSAPDAGISLWQDPRAPSRISE